MYGLQIYNGDSWFKRNINLHIALLGTFLKANSTLYGHLFLATCKSRKKNHSSIHIQYVYMAKGHQGKHLTNNQWQFIFTSILAISASISITKNHGKWNSTIIAITINPVVFNIKQYTIDSLFGLLKLLKKKDGRKLDFLKHKWWKCLQIKKLWISISGCELELHYEVIRLRCINYSAD